MKMTIQKDWENFEYEKQEQDLHKQKQMFSEGGRKWLTMH